MSVRTSLRLLASVLVVAVAACAATHEEPPAPPPPPIDPAAFSGAARPPAPMVDVSADLDAAVEWADAGLEASAPVDSGSDAQVKARTSPPH